MVVIAAHSPAHCFDTAFMAAKIALERMVPVLMLSEGFLGNGSEPWRIPSMSDYPEIHPNYVPSGWDAYKPCERDAETFSRKWAVPGMPGFEHRVGGLEKNHAGVLSNDPDNHELMVRERAAKVAAVASMIPELKVEGEESGGILIVGWGGTYGHILSAFEELRNEGRKVSFAHFDFICPLPANTEEVFRRFRRIIVCELNSGQFASYLRSMLPGHEYLQCNRMQGQTFLVKDIVDGINENA